MLAAHQSDIGATLQRPDGRKIGFAEFGTTTGAPILLVHGFCDSRLTRHPDDAATARLNVRLIAVDRPGIGLSDYRPARSVLDWADDILAVADHLGLGRFAVLGWSGGGPHALACGQRFSERLTAVGVVAGFAPFDRPAASHGMRDDMRKFLPLLRTWPWLANLAVASLPGDYRKDPQRAFEKQFGRGLPECDRQALLDPRVRANLLEGAVEAMRQGSQGLATDMQLFLGRRWGFQPSQLRVPVYLWYGGADTMAPPQMGHYLAESIPGARLTVYPDEGHMIFYSHWSEMLTTLSAAA